MKCPKCGGTKIETGQIDGDFAEICSHCGRVFNLREAIDPSELLRLSEKAQNIDNITNPDIYVGMSCLNGRREALGAIDSFLSGDPSALKKLAGE